MPGLIGSVVSSARAGGWRRPSADAAQHPHILGDSMMCVKHIWCIVNVYSDVVVQMD